MSEVENDIGNQGEDFSGIEVDEILKGACYEGAQSKTSLAKKINRRPSTRKGRRQFGSGKNQNPPLHEEDDDSDKRSSGELTEDIGDDAEENSTQERPLSENAGSSSKKSGIPTAGFSNELKHALSRRTKPDTPYSSSTPSAVTHAPSLATDSSRKKSSAPPEWLTALKHKKEVKESPNPSNPSPPISPTVRTRETKEALLSSHAKEPRRTAPAATPVNAKPIVDATTIKPLTSAIEKKSERLSTPPSRIRHSSPQRHFQSPPLQKKSKTLLPNSYKESQQSSAPPLSPRTNQKTTEPPPPARETLHSFTKTVPSSPPVDVSKTSAGPLVKPVRPVAHPLSTTDEECPPLPPRTNNALQSVSPLLEKTSFGCKGPLPALPNVDRAHPKQIVPQRLPRESEKSYSVCFSGTSPAPSASCTDISFSAKVTESSSSNVTVGKERHHLSSPPFHTNVSRHTWKEEKSQEIVQNVKFVSHVEEKSSEKVTTASDLKDNDDALPAPDIAAENYRDGFKRRKQALETEAKNKKPEESIPSDLLQDMTVLLFSYCHLRPSNIPDLGDTPEYQMFENGAEHGILIYAVDLNAFALFLKFFSLSARSIIWTLKLTNTTCIDKSYQKVIKVKEKKLLKASLRFLEAKECEAFEQMLNSTLREGRFENVPKYQALCKAAYIMNFHPEFLDKERLEQLKVTTGSKEVKACDMGLTPSRRVSVLVQTEKGGEEDTDILERRDVKSLLRDFKQLPFRTKLTVQRQMIEYIEKSAVG